MHVTKEWVPFSLSMHDRLQSVYSLREDQEYVVTVSVRDRAGRLLDRKPYNGGEPVARASSLLLDYSAMFGPALLEAGDGAVEVVFVSGQPYRGVACHYYVAAGGFTCWASQPLGSINHRNPHSKYRGFSVHFVDASVRTCGLAVMNVSTNPAYDRTARLEYDVRDPDGTILERCTLEVPPFGTRWIALGQAAASPAVYTIFARADGTALISLTWTHLINGGLGIDHTQPPNAQMRYGAPIPAGLRDRYRDARSAVSRMIRYRIGRVDDRPLLPFRGRRRP